MSKHEMNKGDAGSSGNAEKLARIEALNRYAGERGYVVESWGTSDFKATFDMAYKLRESDVKSTCGFEISWHPGKSHIYARVEGNPRFHRVLELSGPLADVFLLDMHGLAMKRAFREVRREEDEVMKLRTRLRLDAVVEQMVCLVKESRS